MLSPRQAQVTLRCVHHTLLDPAHPLVTDAFLASAPGDQISEKTEYWGLGIVLPASESQPPCFTIGVLHPKWSRIAEGFKQSTWLEESPGVPFQLC